jgi:hypothetical protein
LNSSIGRFENVVLIPGLYALFIFSLGYLIFKKSKFHGVESWPNVPAVILNHGSEAVSIRSEGRSGTTVGSLNTSWVRYEYSVGGKVYQGDLSSPDGGPLPIRWDLFVGEQERAWHEAWNAYYDPKNPELAVLVPVPYEGHVWLVIIFVTGIPVTAHSLYWLRTRWVRWKAGSIAPGDFSC